MSPSERWTNVESSNLQAHSPRSFQYCSHWGLCSALLALLASPFIYAYLYNSPFTCVTPTSKPNEILASTSPNFAHFLNLYKLQMHIPSLYAQISYSMITSLQSIYGIKIDNTMHHLVTRIGMRWTWIWSHLVNDIIGETEGCTRKEWKKLQFSVIKIVKNESTKEEFK